MKTYSRNEIENKHKQRIYMFSKQPGKTELEKCINFMNSMKSKFIRYDVETINSGTISVIVTPGCVFEVFNLLGERWVNVANLIMVALKMFVT